MSRILSAASAKMLVRLTHAVYICMYICLFGVTITIMVVLLILVTFLIRILEKFFLISVS